MAQEYRTLLAAHILDDANNVSYRSLSRELRVHNNVGKKMLYEFYQHQNSKKPGSVHATYLVSGISNYETSSSNGKLGQEDDGDTHMQSSPFMSSSILPEDKSETQVSEQLITLVREENLEEAKAKYREILSLHIYSLGSSTLQNLQVLSDCSREISAKHVNEDPLEFGKLYGIIQNSQVKRRTGRRAPIAKPSGIAVKPERSSSIKPQEAVKPTLKATKKSSEKVSAGSEGTERVEVNADVKAPQIKEHRRTPAGKPPGVKREQSDIFKSFSRPKAKLNREDTASSAGASPAAGTTQVEISSVLEDELMKDASEDEQAGDFINDAKVSTDPKRSKAERAEQLRRMMEDEDDQDLGTAVEDQNPPSQDSSMALDATQPQKEPCLEPSVVVVGGRRRGRRKVMKKKMLKDDEGYLVTKEETAWESFSEDEPIPHREQTPVSTASSVGKSKKSAGKPGQVNIMSFFGKK